MNGPAPHTERNGTGNDGSTAPDPATHREPPPKRDRSGAGRAGRFWSRRRVPTLLLAAVLAGAAGLLLYDIVSVRAGRPGMYWRRKLAQELAEQPLNETWVVVASCVAMALGLWLALLALTPGLRALLPMRRDATRVRAGLERDAAALVLRDRAMEVSGIRTARVKVHRSKIRVRAQSHFRALDDVRHDLDAALESAVGQLGLARPPSLSIRVRRSKKTG
ncbi:DUF6286 domain-containing protein [Streptomyces sp. 4R-3d]|uniref:DUF6286 domain-containing protein n=1 Tax=Streptomyces sp. 4R-3d TaxID=2559605 RepID=UPI001071A2C8|nr:DUF6286 domain-containing protein [Streptomyces sp. 4R-3d]TFI24990.1 hypothetical protein E4P36_20815 [Streptomyces sp. 4R-3d]